LIYIKRGAKISDYVTWLRAWRAPHPGSPCARHFVHTIARIVQRLGSPRAEQHHALASHRGGHTLDPAWSVLFPGDPTAGSLMDSADSLGQPTDGIA